MSGSIAQSYFVYDQVDFSTARSIFYNFKFDYGNLDDEYAQFEKLKEESKSNFVGKMAEKGTDFVENFGDQAKSATDNS